MKSKYLNFQMKNECDWLKIIKQLRNILSIQVIVIYLMYEILWVVAYSYCIYFNDTQPT